MLIGALVKDYIQKIFEYCETEDRDELYNLMNIEYSKRIFNINFPFCKEVKMILEDDEYVRFWKKDFEVRNKTLRVSSQWVIGSKDMFLDYLLSKSIITDNEFFHFQKNVQKKPAEVKQQISNKTNGDQDYSSKVNDSFNDVNNKKEGERKDNLLFKFDKKIREEAVTMSNHYEILYCLEKTMRNIVIEVMGDKYGFEWWNKSVSNEIKKKVDYNRQNESNTGHTQLSENEIDYTTFGDLRQIIEFNWDYFSNMFKNKFAFRRIMFTLNQLRGTVAHSNYLTEDEVTRLNLTVKDWFRLIEK